MKKYSTGALITALLLTSSVSYATTTYTTDTTVAGTTQTITDTGYIISIGNNAHVTMTGSEVLDVTSTGGETVVFNVGDGNLNAETLDITVKPTAGIDNTYPKALIVRGDSNVTIDNYKADVTLTSVNANAAAGPDSNASYGLTVGYNHAGGSNSATAKATINNATIKVTNTPDTTLGTVSKTYNLGGFRVPVSMQSGHQLSGIKVYRTNGAKPEFISNGKVDIEVTDSSTAKSGDYLAGVYVSGNESSVTFNGETNIKVTANGVNSAGIKIGKPLESSNDGASVTSNGKLTVDTTGINGDATIADEQFHGSGAIRLFGENSRFTVTGNNTTDASVIKASTNAIVFDTQDYVTSGSVFGLSEVLSRNADNNNNVVSLHNTELSTTSETDALIKANSNYAKAGSMMTFGSNFVSGKLNKGLFTVNNAQFSLSGEKSKATAATKGWAIHSNSAYETNAYATPNRVYSSLTANISDKALIIGQMHKDESAVLNVNISDKATWQLAKKEDLTDQLSTVSAVTLSNDGSLDAGTNLTDGSKAVYTVKLTSDGTASDGTFTNGGIVTMVNNKYEDKLTIDGNYVGNGGKLKMDTKWDSPGDLTGSNSQSDLLTITGTANGSTTVIPVAADGREAVIDGSIGSIQADLHAITVPVVHVETESGSSASAFTGTAATTGAGELQLRTRVNADGTRDYFWEVTAVNPEDPTPTPIYNKGVSGYVQMPQVDLDLGYASMRTLHERRGENYKATLTKGAVNNDYDQTWARIVKDYLKVDGKDRFSYTNHIDGIQIGHDFEIKEDKNHDKRFSGVYFSYLRGKANFFDQFKAENGVVTTDKFTGSGLAKSYALGVTTTKYKENGAYVDLVGQFSLLRNEYNALGSSKLEQNGWGFGASVESGRPYILKEKDNKRLVLEPQGQIVFQYLNLNDMNHDNKFIQQPKQYGLKGRIGARLSYDSYSADAKLKDTVYGVVNIWQDLAGAHSVNIGQDRLTERYARTIGEIGVGTQLNLSDSTYFYGDFRYQHSLGAGSTKGYRGQIGLKYTF